jgi:hypothetical protein
LKEKHQKLLKQIIPQFKLSKKRSQLIITKQITSIIAKGVNETEKLPKEKRNEKLN